MNNLSRRKKIIFAFIPVFLFFAIFEGGLRLLQFRYLKESYDSAKVIDLLNNAVQTDLLIRDDVFIWKYNPKAAFEGRSINSLGFLDKERQISKPPESIRILSLGDSCTAHGHPPYTSILEDKLNAVASSTRKYEVINAGVYSYSTFQGVQVAKKIIPLLKPDIVIILYGWNDHVLSSSGLTDLETGHILTKKKMSGLSGKLSIPKFIRQFRIFQLCHYVITPFKSQKNINKTRKTLRVPPSDYENNLSELVKICHENSAIPVVLISPQNLIPNSIMTYFISVGFFNSLDEFKNDHLSYQKLTQEIAEQEKVQYIDLENYLNQFEKKDIFTDDGIHWTDNGRKVISDKLSELIRKLMIDKNQLR